MSIKNDKQIDLRLIDINREVVASGPAISPEQAFAKGHTRYLAEDLPHVLGRIMDWARSHTREVEQKRKERGIGIEKMNDSAIQRYMQEAGFNRVETKEAKSGIMQHHFEYRGMKCAIHIAGGQFFRFSADKPIHRIWHSPTPEQFSSQRNSSYTEKDMPRIMKMIKSHLDAHIEGKSE